MIAENRQLVCTILETDSKNRFGTKIHKCMLKSIDIFIIIFDIMRIVTETS